MNWIKALLLAALSLAPAATHAQVFQLELEGRQQRGQGYARPRGPGECLIVAPLHVVSDSLSAITATAENGVSGEARILDQNERADVAILKFSGSGAVECPDWKIPQDLSARLSDASLNAVLRVREGDQIRSIPVWIRSVGSTEVTITPRLPGDYFAAGMSGGQLLVAGAFGGILLSTERTRDDARRSSETARVLRSDALERLLSAMFARTAPRELGSRPPAPLGVPSNEPDLWLRRGESVVLGDQNSGFGILRDSYAHITVSRDGAPWGMSPGTRYEFKDSRGECYIIYLRAEVTTGGKRHGFAIRCNATSSAGRRP